MTMEFNAYKVSSEIKDCVWGNGFCSFMCGAISIIMCVVLRFIIWNNWLFLLACGLNGAIFGVILHNVYKHYNNKAKRAINKIHTIQKVLDDRLDRLSNEIWAERQNEDYDLVGRTK